MKKAILAAMLTTVAAGAAMAQPPSYKQQLQHLAHQHNTKHHAEINTGDIQDLIGGHDETGVYW